MSATPKISDYSPPTVTDDDIELLAKQASLSLDEERKAILRSMSRIDVRACPGSGKTTLLVAKLALLASKWRWRTRGICVLSHTNVASKEIRSRFVELPALVRLNSHPHFIGTIQSFIDRFLGVHGALLKFGKRPSVIDNDRYRFEACEEFFKGSEYDVARSALRVVFRDNPQRTPSDCVSEIEYCDANLSLSPVPSKSKPWGEDAPSFKALKKLKDALSRRGYYRFGDMDSLALLCLERNPSIVPSLRHRFPIVLVDEMQDTSRRHSDLLEKLFGDGVAFQRIGDDRQAIYSEATSDEDANESTFPSATALSMSRSFRLSPAVSALVSNLCPDPVESIQGNPSRRDGRHTVFVFTKQSISRVLPSFAELVADDVGTGLPASDVKAVGAVQKVKEGEKHFPGSIPVYWPDFEAPKREKRLGGASLGSYLQIAAWRMRTEGDVGVASQAIVEAMSRLLRLEVRPDCPLDIRPHMLLASLQTAAPALARRLRKEIAEICSILNDPNKVVSMDDLTCLSASMAEVRPGKWNQPATAFWQLADKQDKAQPSNPSLEVRTNIFRHANVEVTVDTIHSVKGETLKAILLLDTFQHTQHLASLLELGYLLGERPAKKPGKRVVGHLRRAFVATTRATDLLCLALCAEHLSDDRRDGLSQLGWRVVDV